MNFYPLVQKLIEIERAIDVLEPRELRELVIEAQENAIQMQKEIVETLGAEYASFRPPVEPALAANQTASTAHNSKGRAGAMLRIRDLITIAQSRVSSV